MREMGMMNLKIAVPALNLTFVLLFGFAAIGPVSASASSFGPRSPELRLNYYRDEAVLYSALKNGDIDMSLWPVTQSQYQDAITDPSVLLAPVSKLDMRAWSVNNNETIRTYPGVRSPTSYVGFRKALWRLTNVNYYTEVICGGWATPVYVPISAPSRSWVNTTVEEWVKVNYSFSVEGAAALLDAEGFVQGTQPNPYYKPSVPGSAQYWRVYPTEHSKAGQKLDPIVFVARVDDGIRYAMSVHLRDRMLESGLPVNFIAPPIDPYMKVQYQRDYHIYSAGWSTGRFATYLYGWFHTSRWYYGGSNYHVSTTSPGYVTAPGHPDNLDEAVDKVQNPSSKDEAVKAAKNAQSLLVQEYASFIPLWSSKAFYPYRNLYGVTNMESVGPESIYTFQQTWRADGGTAIRVGHKSPPTQVNQIYSSWVWDVTTMGFTQDGFTSLEPYDILSDQSWLVRDWTTAQGGSSGIPETWVDPDDGKTKSVMRYWFRDDAEWIKPKTGEILADFATQWLKGGYEFNCWYFDTEPMGWVYANYRDIKHIVPDLAGKYADVYFDLLSGWSQYWPWGRHLYSNQSVQDTPDYPGWKLAPLSTREKRTFNGPVSTGTFLDSVTPVEGAAYAIPERSKGTPVEVIEVKLDGMLLAKAATPQDFNSAVPGSAGGDYSIVGGSANGPRIRIFRAVPAGSILTVKYWARGDPIGYHPGNLGWDKTLAGTGQYYMTDYLSGVGGYATYKANTNYFMETPPKGEIDWYWNWIDGPQPRDGCYHLDIYDATFASWALDGSGKAVPTTNWLEASDLASPLGSTDIFDIAVLSANYDTKFGRPSSTLSS
jgi:hypothetical protein